MAYEVVDPAERDERGVIYPSLTDAMVNAGPRVEVWALADDEAQTRTVLCWPDPEFEPARIRLAKGEADVSTIAEARANRVAAELLDKYPVTGYAQRVAVLALAYMTGERAGMAQAFGIAERSFVRLIEELR